MHTTAAQTKLRTALSELNPPLWLLAPFSIVALADIAITYYALYHINGPFYETNLLAVFLMQHIGAAALPLTYLLGISVWTTLAIIHPWRTLAFRILGTLYLIYATYIVIANIILVHPQLPLV